MYNQKCFIPTRRANKILMNVFLIREYVYLYAVRKKPKKAQALYMKPYP